MNLRNNDAQTEASEKLIDCKKSPMMLINEVSRLMGEKFREKYDRHPVMHRSGRILLIELSKKDGRTQLDLANATHLKAPTISVALQKLEREGYVSRRPYEYDLRATRVFLTERGRALDTDIKQHIMEEEAIVTAILSKEESETLVKLLCKIKNNILNSGERGED